ncbi:Serine/threonine-protein kinase RsbT [Usitatibacter rugosus]|uniref:Serine/threonine-protein kinase RsbT n=1 Tax=Usitatibacter rugosus TaxID=2732067 RepID=A0A6M4H0T8_9PROT|nr:anti-sigma regulatory factor [Usitatibacter rugosus]QJR12965.1 Serine/threonine-protein kinase RsbT [Usitatibacter rugosus]
MADVTTVQSDKLPLKTGEDVVRLRQLTREHAVRVGLSLVDQTKVITAASELGRNTITYGGGGEALVDTVQNGTRRGVRLVFTDQGPGIADMRLALTPGYTSGGGLGLGLTGARSLSDEFDIQSEPGKGTRVTITRWKPF